MAGLKGFFNTIGTMMDNAAAAHAARLSTPITIGDAVEQVDRSISRLKSERIRTSLNSPEYKTIEVRIDDLEAIKNDLLRLV